MELDFYGEIIIVLGTGSSSFSSSCKASCIKVLDFLCMDDEFAWVMAGGFIPLCDTFFTPLPMYDF